MKKIVLLLLVGWLFSKCALATENDSSTSVAKPWAVSASLLSEADKNKYLRYCVQKNEGAWNRIDKCELTDEKSEEIVLDPWTKTIYLGATAPTKTSRMRSTRGWECFYGVFGTSSRSKHGYSICNSSFSKGVTGAGEAVVGNLINVAFGTIRKSVAVDSDALLSASVSLGILTEAYRSAFASITTSTTSNRITKLITQFRNDDPDNLLPQALDKLKAAEASELAQDAERLAQDAERLKIHNEKRLRESETLERQRKIWLESAQVGDYCWVGPFKVGYQNNLMARGLIVDKKPPLLKVQYDGSTNNKGLTLDHGTREEWVRIENVYPTTTTWNEESKVPGSN